MGAGRKAANGRREPLFDATPIPGMGLRLSAADRVAPASEDSSERRSTRARRQADDEEGPAVARRSGSERARRKAANDDSRDSKSQRDGRRGRAAKGGGGGGWRRGVRRMAYWGVVLGIWAAIAALGVLIWVGAHLPPIQSLELPKRPPSVQIVSTSGVPLATRGEMGGAAVPLRELPKYLPQAFMAIEDRRFYDHYGVDLIGVARAVVANVLRRGVSQGGSTLTQQLAKNVFLTQERTLERKLQELLLAFWLEHKFTKAQILELYVNRVYFGAGAYGVEAAAQRYFGKSARAVTLGEAAMLAGLVKSPSRLAPTRNPEGAQKRAQVVLAAMADAGFVTPEMAKAAQQRQVTVRAVGSNSANYVADWVMDVLDDLVGRFDEDLVVETTIDPTLQKAAEESLVDELDQKGEKLNMGQGALLSMSPDGAVRALVGGRNYAESQFNRAIAARRQPGSAFKPFVYLAAIERGLTPDTLRDDRPINVRGWQPENYTREYFGQVPLARALAMSLNTVAVRLTLEVGPKVVTQTAHRLGIASKLEPNASIALGTSEVSMLEMVTAFAPFANGGLAVVPYVVTKVRTADGRLLYRQGSSSLGRIIEPRAVGMMNTMMRETLTIGTGRKAEFAGWPAAGKTGTTQDFHDAWFVGYTGHLVTAVWVGNDDSSAMRKVTGGGPPAEVWARFMKTAHQGVAVVDLPGVSGRGPSLPTLAAAPASRPPSGIAAPPERRPAPQTLDGWFLDKVFGRR